MPSVENVTAYFIKEYMGRDVKRVGEQARRVEGNGYGRLRGGRTGRKRELEEGRLTFRETMIMTMLCRS